MKKIILFCLAIIATTVSFAQDVIVTTDSKKIEAKIVEVSGLQVKYLDFNYQEGPTFVLSTDEISSIIFSNGQVKVYEHNTPKSIVLKPELKNEHIIRSGNRYYYNGEMMRGKVYASFLQNNCTEAFKEYRKGRIVSNIGWCLMMVGLALDFASIGSGSIKVMIPAAILEIGCIPTLAIGYAQMHRSAEIFNSTCVAKSQAYWSVTASQNGVGLALNF